MAFASRRCSAATRSASLSGMRIVECAICQLRCMKKHLPDRQNHQQNQWVESSHREGCKASCETGDARFTVETGAGYRFPGAEVTSPPNRIVESTTYTRTFAS